MTKYKPQAHPGKYVNTKRHWIVDMGVQWLIESSNKKSTYQIQMHDGGFTCSCPARLRCKHISMVEQSLSGPI